ncbi:MAG: STAS domain-containing protein, partial [Actinomycetota bacterium]
CCYDRRRVEDRGVTDVASLHPLVRAPAGLVPFRLWSSGTGLVLEGEVDYFSAGDLRRMLRLAAPVAGDVRLDLGGLGFVDHHGLRALADHARTLERAGSRLVPVGAPPVVDRLCGLLRIQFPAARRRTMQEM